MNIESKELEVQDDLRYFVNQIKGTAKRLGVTTEFKGKDVTYSKGDSRVEIKDRDDYWLTTFYKYGKYDGENDYHRDDELMDAMHWLEEK